ncbi:MAG TPA: ROK family protein, partial [Firmicutes bacterium]|nr:ROK family protein [Bacillota bacterium]
QAQAWIQRELGKRAADIPVGVAINSPFEHGSIIRFNNNLPELNGFAVRPYLERAIGSAVRLEWDINAALLGELRAGAARGVDRVAMVSVGTGLGAAVAVGGQLLRWLFNQTPGEIGHMVVARDGPPCTCGGRGCWEAMVSARGVMRAARDLAASGRFPSLRPVLEGTGDDPAFTPEALSARADQGDEGARAVWQEVGEWLGVGIASLVQIFLAELIIVGGGISLAGEKLLGPCRTAARKHVATNLRDSFEVTTAALGADSAIIGAASLWA